MKLGLLTYHNIPNIGATLQAYALWKVLNDIGLPTEILDYKCENIMQRELVCPSRKNPLKHLLLRYLVWPHTQRRIHGCLLFMQAQHCFSSRFYTKKNISQANAEYDGFISGSDMIWNRDVNGYDDTYFLDFVESAKKKYAYASSIGDTWQEKELAHIHKLLSRYNLLSTREEDTAQFIAQHFKLPTQWVADPTLLLSCAHWQEFTEPVPYKNYVLVYFPYKDVLQAARRYAKKHHKKLLVISNNLLLFRSATTIRITNPQQWMSLIRYADAVFTDSYHGLLFSLYFERPVWTHNPSNRLQSMLKRLHIEHRFIPNDRELASTLDYNQVNPLLKEFRQESMQFLYKIAQDFGKKTPRTPQEFKNSIDCSGCSACQEICPKQAIRLEPDAEGFLRPVIDQTSCVRCNLCHTVCPAEKDKNRLLNTQEPLAFAAKYEDNVIRARSASGAFFPAIAKHFLEKGGYVCGCVLDNMHPVHIVSNHWEDVVRMQDSKYVQSDMHHCFTQIKTLLHQKKPVLFTGTSCQVAGLKLFLQTAHTPTDTLCCVDFFCHGVPSPKIWHEFLTFYEHVKKRMIVAFRFRNKIWGWGMGKNNYRMNILLTEKWGNPSHKSRIFGIWQTIFFSNLCLRRYCGTCPYTTIYKPADITMGDFWGIEQVLPSFNDGKGSSVLLAHCDKAVNLLSQIEGLTIAEVNTQAAVKRQANAVAPSPVPPNRRQFWQDYYKNGFEYVMKNYFHYTLYIRFKQWIKYILFKLGLRKKF